MNTNTQLRPTLEQAIASINSGNVLEQTRAIVNLQLAITLFDIDFVNQLAADVAATNLRHTYHYRAEISDSGGHPRVITMDGICQTPDPVVSMDQYRQLKSDICGKTRCWNASCTITSFAYLGEHPLSENL